MSAVSCPFDMPIGLKNFYFLLGFLFFIFYFL
jgi:hypothetical protein